MKRKKYLNLLLSPLKIEFISIAIKIKLFDLLQEASSLESISKQLDFDTSNTKIFLEALVHLKLLKYKNKLFKNSSFSNRYFVTTSEYYMGDVFLYRKEFFEKSKQNIFDIIKKGSKVDMNLQDSKQWAKASKKYFFQEQKAMLSELVIDVVNSLENSKDIKKILDLGCNSGVLSLELLKQNSNYKAVLFDFKDVIQQTKKNIKKYQLEKRVTTLYGDILKDDIQKGYDLVICSNILHLLPKKKKVLKKIYNSLNENGILLIIQSNFLEESTQKKNNYFYNLLPRLYDKNYHKNYPTLDMISKSGFSDIEHFISDKPPRLNTKFYIAKR